jgi:hypothetical protein
VQSSAKPVFLSSISKAFLRVDGTRQEDLLIERAVANRFMVRRSWDAT